MTSVPNWTLSEYASRDRERYQVGDLIKVKSHQQPFIFGMIIAVETEKDDPQRGTYHYFWLGENVVFQTKWYAVVGVWEKVVDE